MKSFIETANKFESHFPIQNIPFGIFSTKDNSTPRPGVAIGDKIFNLREASSRGLLDGIAGLDDPQSVFAEPTLNKFMSFTRPVWSATRKRIQEILSSENAKVRDDAELCSRLFAEQKDATMHLPAQIGDYTDFYCSREHATNVGIMFRGKDNALQPNWLHIPVGYHGRASSVVVSGTDIRRPVGQILGADKKPSLGVSKKLDIEVEVGWFVGTGNKLGERVNIKQAKDHIFGLVLMNDWSARDIQAWEYVPLGPFLGKSFGTTISPWIVTLDALEPFLVDGPSQDSPKPLEYLQETNPSAYDVKLEFQLKPADKSQFYPVAKTNLKNMYWSITQQLTHHTVNGCNLRPGDMGATGTISGPDESSYGSLLELTWNGDKEIDVGGAKRKFLENDDEVNLTGYCEKEGGYRVGFGDCCGKILEAHPF